MDSNSTDFQMLNVTRENDGQTLVVRLDHGKVNACGSAVIADFESLAELVQNDSTIRAMIAYSSKITKSGKAIFVAGADVTERADWTDADVIKHVTRQRRALLSLRQLPIFSMVLVDGLALGLGTELMLAFDYRIASPKASYALPETGLGIIPGALGSALLSAVVGPNHALRMGCTGEAIHAEEALRIGLVDELQDSPEESLARARTMAANIVKKSPRAIAGFKTAVLSSLSLPQSERVRLEAKYYEDQVKSGDAAVGRAAFKDIREGRAPSWPQR
ncbi:MAG: enoyl-CoA hydratase/isomerase family protein [Planctomycetota bacterium]|nr:enoyl-CoA hydratase/isomerase family protein [Planctomycetota bacterium]